MELIINSELSQQIQDIDFSGSSAASSELVKAILLLAHPVGSYYWSSDATNPHDIFGGTWAQIKDKFIIAVGDSHTAGTSYGSNTKDISHTHSYAHTHGVPGVAHTHTGPSHSHTYGFKTRGWYGTLYEQFQLYDNGTWKSATPTSNTNVTTTRSGLDTATDSPAQDLSATASTSSAGTGNTGSTTPSATTTNSQSTTTSGSGGSTSLDITPACIAAYCWRRTA